MILQHRLARWTLGLSVAAFAAAPLAAQDDDRPSRDRDQPRVQRDGDRPDRPGRQRDGERRDGERTAEREEAMTHFLAGYYAGYADGYDDGSDDWVLYVTERQRRQQEQRKSAGRDPQRMQEGRKRLRERQRDRMRSEARGVRTVTVEGEIIGTKTVPIRGTDVEHRVVRIETEFGDRRVADLGPADATADLDLAEGDTVEVTGHPIAARGMLVVAARKVTAGDRTVEIEYRRPNRRDDGESRDDGELRDDGEDAERTDRPRRRGNRPDRR
ncbi:hypothetical protein [Alienimonas sp. DA493]|uniref:hypothetical protein n=1 Tax=Alienimonas sp. DA493 TaxID=3373605 RepID=UPI0037542729